jgi:uncharacterized protein (DUF1330 family)
MDFPSKQALINMFDSDTYKALIPIRKKGFESINIFFADNFEGMNIFFEDNLE